MTLIIVLLFFKSICINLQNIVLHCYNRFLNPRQKYYTSGPITGGGLLPQNRGQHRSSASSWSWWLGSTNSLNQSRPSEREQLLGKIRARKRAAKSRSHEQPTSAYDWDDEWMILSNSFIEHNEHILLLKWKWTFVYSFYNIQELSSFNRSILKLHKR